MEIFTIGISFLVTREIHFQGSLSDYVFCIHRISLHICRSSGGMFGVIVVSIIDIVYRTFYLVLPLLP